MPAKTCVLLRWCIKYVRRLKFILVQVEKALNLVESRTGRKFGDSTNPLLVSVRSGARASMPGLVE